MNFELTYRVPYSSEPSQRRRTVTVSSVTNAGNEDITPQFFNFCSRRALSLTTETEIEKAVYEFGKE